MSVGLGDTSRTRLRYMIGLPGTPETGTVHLIQNVRALFICSLSYDRSISSSKASSSQSAIQSFLRQMRVFSPVLQVIQQLPTSSSSSSCHFYPPFYLSFNNPLQKAVSTQNVTNPVSLPFSYFMQDIPLLLDSNTSLFFTCSVQLISILLPHHIP